MSDLLPGLAPDDFDAAIADPERLVLVDFWADWCAPCHAMTPVLAEFAESQPGVAVYGVDTVEHPTLAERFDVMSLPTLLLFRAGELVHRTSGVKRMPQLRKLAEQHGAA